MNRRGFLSALGALVTTATLPKVPAIPLGNLYNPIVLKVMLNTLYGKMYQGGRVIYAAHDGVITTDVRSAYPSVFEKVKALREQKDEQVYRAFHT